MLICHIRLDLQMLKVVKLDKVYLDKKSAKNSILISTVVLLICYTNEFKIRLDYHKKEGKDNPGLY